VVVWGYSGCGDEHMGGWYYVLGCLVILLHWKGKNWGGLYDIVGGKCINKRVQTE